MEASLRLDARLFQRDMLLLAAIVAAIDAPLYILVSLAANPTLAALMFAVLVPLLAYAAYLGRAGWLGVVVGEGWVRARYVSCIRVREVTARAQCRVKLVTPGDPLWPVLRLCGTRFTTGFGLFQARDGTRYYALMAPQCEAAAYIEAGDLRLFVCCDGASIHSFLERVRGLCRVEL